MITHNINSAFIQIKSVHLHDFTSSNATVEEVVEMTVQLRKGFVRLDDVFLSAVDETLNRIFKEEGVKVIYGFIENERQLQSEQIIERPEDFSAGLQMLVGSAAPVIEKMMLKNLHSKLDLKFVEKEGYEFSDYIKELKKVFT